MPLSRRAALFEPPPRMVAEAWPWVSRVHAGMCLRRLQAFGFATPQQVAAARSLLQEQIARIAKDLAEYKDVKDVVQESEVSKRLAPNYSKPLIYVRQSASGRLAHQPMTIDTSSSVWWNAFTQGKTQSVGSGAPPKFLAALKGMMERSLAHLRTAPPQAATEMARLSDKLERMSGGIWFPSERETARDFDIDIGGWKYWGGEVPENWLQYTLVLSPWQTSQAVGLWIRKGRKIVGYLGEYLEPANRAQLEEFQHEIRSTLEHELVHLAQSLLKAIRVLKKEPGLVSRRVQPSKIYDIYGHPPGWEDMSAEERERWEEEHALQEIEFQPRLRDEVRAFRRIAPRLRRDQRRQLLRAWLLPFEKVEPRELSPQWERAVELARNRVFFDALYRRERPKWRNAAAKFIKSVEDLL